MQAVALRTVNPRSIGATPPQDAVDDTAVIDRSDPANLRGGSGWRMLQPQSLRSKRAMANSFWRSNHNPASIRIPLKRT